MQDTLTIDAPTPTEPPRRSSGSLKAVNEWWTEFGDVSGSVRSGKLLSPERVETSGLIYLQQLKAKTTRPVMRFSAATPMPMPVAAPEPAPEPVVSLPQPNALMPVVLPAASRSFGRVSAWLTALASVVLVASVGLIAWQTRQGAPAACPAPSARPPAAAGDQAPRVVTAPPALSGPGAPAPAPRVVAAAAAPQASDAAPADAQNPDRAAPRRTRSSRSTDREAAPAKVDPPATAPAAPASVYDSLAALQPQPTVYDKLAAVQPKTAAPAAAPPPPQPPRTAAALLQAAVVGKSTAAPAVAALPTTLPTALVLARLRSRSNRVSACLRQFGFLRDTVQVRVTISGTTGRAASVQALGQFAGTPAGGCVERALGGLDFGRFQADTQSVTVPFVVR